MMSKLRKILPPFIMKMRFSSQWKPWKNRANKDIFSEIYSEKIWGASTSSTTPFYSGIGSHEEDTVRSYVEAVNKVISANDDIITVVDLGCGDFNIGSKLVKNIKNYIGCDVVHELIQFNNETFSDKNVKFITLDIITDELPDGDLVTIRQVLQHLTNDQINKVLSKIKVKYNHFILTEHLSKLKKFRPNVDIPTGAITRAHINSGVMIEEPPFSFKYKEKEVVSEVQHFGGLVRTTYYRIK